VAVTVEAVVAVGDGPEPPHSTRSCGLLVELSRALTLRALEESPIITNVIGPFPLTCAVTSISIHTPDATDPRFANGAPAVGIVFQVIPVSLHEVSVAMANCGPFVESSRVKRRSVARETGLPAPCTLKRR